MKLPKYHNADTCKDQILSDNQNKSGIYMWKNTINDKCYVGSAENQSNRLSFYYSNSSMESLIKKSKSHICSALLKDGRSNFSLEILEYCEPDKCIQREKYYIDLLGSEYNIVKDPTLPPMSGRKHSDSTKIIMSDAKKGENNPMFGQNLSNETKKIMSDAAKKIDHSGRFKSGENHPNYGQPRIEGAGKLSQKIEVIDNKNNQTTTYDSIREAAEALNIHQTVISKYFSRNQQKPYKGQYTFKKL